MIANALKKIASTWNFYLIKMTNKRLTIETKVNKIKKSKQNILSDYSINKIVSTSV